MLKVYKLHYTLKRVLCCQLTIIAKFDGLIVLIPSIITTISQGTEENPCVNPNAKGFRLPTSNEWKLAARYIGTTAPTISLLSTQAELSGGIYWTPDNYASGATDSYNNAAATTYVAVYSAKNTAVVKSKTSNGLGLYDMNGNVKEFSFDWIPGLVGSIRIAHGGGYFDNAYFQRLSAMDGCFPEGTYSNIGFRPVRGQ